MKKSILILGLGIIMILSIILFMFIGYFIEATNIPKNETKTNNTTTQNNTNVPDADFSYYLPSEFAAIKITRGAYETTMTGVTINFEDDDGKIWEYNSTKYPETYETKEYTIFRDNLNPAVAENWNFTKVKFVSFKYILGEGVPSGVIMRMRIDSNKSQNFGSCNIVNEQGEQISCN